MKEKEARELLKELFERHSVPLIPIKFHPTPMITKGEDIPKLKEIGLGHLAAAVTVITKGEFKVDPVTRERWIEFYGLPTANTIRREFKYYLDLLGVEYIRKKKKKERWGIFSPDGELIEWYPSKEKAETRQSELTVVFGIHWNSKVRKLKRSEG